jgi:hypothetical protein
MNFTVNWDDDALASLAAIWTIASDRPAVNNAQGRIDYLLAVNPVGNSKPRSEGLHVIEVHPLRVLFEVSEAEQLVRVVSVARLA